MTEICLAKSLANILWIQLNQKSRLSKYLLKRARKNKRNFGIPLQRDRGGVLGNSIQNLISAKDMGNQGKKYSTETTVQHAPVSWNITKERNKKEHKEKLFQGVFSIYNSHGRSG